MEACPLSLDAAIGRGLDGAVQGAFEIGPVSRALDGQPEELRTAAAASIREALTPFAKGDAVLLPASVWIVTAKGVVAHADSPSRHIVIASDNREAVSTVIASQRGARMRAR